LFFAVLAILSALASSSKLWVLPVVVFFASLLQAILAIQIIAGIDAIGRS
jgi:hypothetical protein